MNTSAQIHRPDDMATARQTEVIIKQAIAELPDDQRELVVLRDIENMTYDEIQDVTGLPEGTVKSRLHRARLALHARVAELQRGRESKPS